MNGWTNWATWNVELWFENDEALYHERRRFLIRHNEPTADQVEEFVKDRMPKGTPDMDSEKEFNDVNWEELAENWGKE